MSTFRAKANEYTLFEGYFDVDDVDELQGVALRRPKGSKANAIFMRVEEKRIALP